MVCVWEEGGEGGERGGEVDIRPTVCAVSKPHLHTVLTPLLVLQTILGQCERARTLCVHKLQLQCCFDNASSQPTLFSERAPMVSVQTSRAECALDHDKSPSEPFWTPRNRLSL